jgi:hypothetical protein
MLASAGYVFPLHEVDDVMREQSRPGDAVIYYLSDDMAKITYERQADFYTRWRGLDAVFVEPRASADTRAEVRTAALSVLEGHERVWIASVPEDVRTDYDIFTAALAQQYALCRVVRLIDSLQLELYTRSAEACQ